MVWIAAAILFPLLLVETTTVIGGEFSSIVRPVSVIKASGLANYIQNAADATASCETARSDYSWGISKANRFANPADGPGPNFPHRNFGGVLLTGTVRAIQNLLAVYMKHPSGLRDIERMCRNWYSFFLSSAAFYRRET